MTLSPPDLVSTLMKTNRPALARVGSVGILSVEPRCKIVGATHAERTVRRVKVIMKQGSIASPVVPGHGGEVVNTIKADDVSIEGDGRAQERVELEGQGGGIEWFSFSRVGELKGENGGDSRAVGVVAPGEKNSVG